MDMLTLTAQENWRERVKKEMAVCPKPNKFKLNRATLIVLPPEPTAHDPTQVTNNPQESMFSRYDRDGSGTIDVDGVPPELARQCILVLVLAP